MQIKLAHFLPTALLTVLGHVEGVDEVVVLVGERPVAGPQHRAQHREDVGVLDTAAHSSHCSLTRAGHEPLRSFMITEKAVTRAISWLKAATIAVTFMKKLL